MDYEIEQYGISEKLYTIQLFLPELGNITIRHQDAPLTNEREVTLYIDFDPKLITIVDGAGNDHKVGDTPSLLNCPHCGIKIERQ